MKTWYCVATSLDDQGCVTAGITNIVQSAEEPESTRTKTETKEIYSDWFCTEAEARKFAEEARMA